MGKIYYERGDFIVEPIAPTPPWCRPFEADCPGGLSLRMCANTYHHTLVGAIHESPDERSEPALPEWETIIVIFPDSKKNGRGESSAV